MSRSGVGEGGLGGRPASTVHILNVKQIQSLAVIIKVVKGSGVGPEPMAK